jgi:inosine-uridine nucleoside N-ribohydrolase
VRTGYVRYVLRLVGRDEIPVAAGADTSQGFYPYPLPVPEAARYWPEPIAPAPNPPEDALALLRQSIARGATVIGIGPLTNLALLERAYPGSLHAVPLFLMGGYLVPPRSGYPDWTNDDDFNVQVDVASAHYLLPRVRPTLITLAATAETALRRAHLPTLRAQGGVLGNLIARQAEAFAEDERMAERFGAICAGVPEDIINFQHDGLACAVALGLREGIEMREVPLVYTRQTGRLVASVDEAGTPARVVTRVDGAYFNQFWLDGVVGRGPFGLPHTPPLT